MTDYEMWAAATLLYKDRGLNGGMKRAGALADSYRAHGDEGGYACWIIIMSRIPLLLPAKGETLH